MRNSNLSKRGLMRRATTPTHIFTFPSTVLVTGVSEMLITYSQCGKTILEKNLDDLSSNAQGNNFSLVLTQNEVNKFAPGKALVQIKAKVNSAVLVSQMIWLTVKPALNSEEM